MKIKVISIMAGILMLIAVSLFACGGDDEENDEYPPETCSFWGCKITCFYESLPGEDNEPLRIDHEVGDGIVESSEEQCTVSSLYLAFEAYELWGGDIMDACEELEGYVTPDSTESIKFDCEDTEWHPEETSD